MPIYLFENTKTGETHEVVYHMDEPKDYRGPNGKAAAGVWRRVWIKPQMAVDAMPIDPYSAKDYIKATNKKGVIGDLWDRSAELSAKRTEKEGVDPVKETFYKRYSAKRKGAKHPQQKREETARELKRKGITVDFGD